jgi:hypothetical protein
VTDTRHPADLLRDADARRDLETIRTWECPKCGAVSGEKCIRPDGAYQHKWTHVERTRLAFPLRDSA